MVKQNFVFTILEKTPSGNSYRLNFRGVVVTPNLQPNSKYAFLEIPLQFVVNLN